MYSLKNSWLFTNSQRRNTFYLSTIDNSFIAASLVIVLLFQASQGPYLINHGNNINILSPSSSAYRPLWSMLIPKTVFPFACIDRTRILPRSHSPGWLSPWSQWGSLGTNWINKNEHRTLRNFQTSEIKKFCVFPPVDVVLNPHKLADEADLRNAPNLFIFLLFQKKTQIYIFRFFFLHHITESCVLLLFLPHITTYFHTHGSIPAAKKHVLT